MYTFLVFYTHTTYLAHLIFLDLRQLTMKKLFIWQCIHFVDKTKLKSYIFH